MADKSELLVIHEEVNNLKDKKTLSSSDINCLMLIAGRLTGILRVCSNDNKNFIMRADDMMLSHQFNVANLFYLIPVTIELIDKQYSGNVKSIRKRYHARKKKHTHEAESDRKDIDEEKGDLGDHNSSAAEEEEDPLSLKSYCVRPDGKLE